LSIAVERLGNAFYIALALVVMAYSTYSIVGGQTHAMRNQAYDLAMKYRFLQPAADPDIVVVDVDEPSLAAMAPEYGRWPWPRNIMGELIDGIAAQKPRAIVFDITFSDPDVYNVEGDRYLRDVVARTPNVFFPIIRLDESNDARSSLRIRQLSGTQPLDGASPDATIAAVVPFFLDSLGERRTGTTNLFADAEGILRTYHVYLDANDWRIYSLPANVAASLGAELPEGQQIVLNWRGRPPSYRHVSLHEIYFDLQKRERTRAANEFADKIVVVGSTAPALFDYKPTPVAKAHPGVEILATSIDNLRNGDYLVLLPVYVTVTVTLIALAMLAAAFVYRIDQWLLNLVFTLFQTGLLAVAYLVLNVSTVFVDLTAPFVFSLLYFTVARFADRCATLHRNGHPYFSRVLDAGNECRVVLAHAEIRLPTHNASLRLRAEIKKEAGRARHAVVTAPLFKGAPLLHAFFRDSLQLYWLVPAAQEREAIQDALRVLEQTLPVIERSAARHAQAPRPIVTWALHAVHLGVDAAGQWRLKGEAAMAEVVALAHREPPRGEAGSTQFVASSGFRELCRRLDTQAPAALAGAGLHL
jgi:CHASE2 domain-containing sensor protein